MDLLKNNSQALILTISLCWGIHELRKITSSCLPVIQDFIEIMKNTNRNVEELKPIILNINKKVNDLSQEEDGVSLMRGMKDLILSITNKINAVSNEDVNSILEQTKLLMPIIEELSKRIIRLTDGNNDMFLVQQIQILVPIISNLNERINSLAHGDEDMFLVQQIRILVPIISNLNEKINSLADGDESVFPVVADIHNLTQKVNTIFTRLYCPLGAE